MAQKTERNPRQRTTIPEKTEDSPVETAATPSFSDFFSTLKDIYKLFTGLNTSNIFAKLKQGLIRFNQPNL